MIGKWIDGLGDVERDRVIEAQGWCFAAWNDGDGNRCLLSHALDLNIVRHRAGFFNITACEAGLIRPHHRVFMRFDTLCSRFGKDKIVRAIKARAARGVTSRVVESAPEVVAHG